jgi:hypothetical protein
MHFERENDPSFRVEYPESMRKNHQSADPKPEEASKPDLKAIGQIHSTDFDRSLSARLPPSPSRVSADASAEEGRATLPRLAHYRARLCLHASGLSDHAGDKFQPIHDGAQPHENQALPMAIGLSTKRAQSQPAGAMGQPGGRVSLACDYSRRAFYQLSLEAVSKDSLIIILHDEMSHGEFFLILM